MIRRRIAILTSLACITVTAPLAAQGTAVPAEYADVQARYSPNQLDNLVGPVALYPDALLAQVLVAATFPDQVQEAARFVRANGTDGIDDQNWDVSVKAVAHYPSALNMMADKSDWTATLGRAYANQSSDVMVSVQRMRSMAAQQGNLVNTPQQNVITEGSSYVIVPAQPRVIYVPVYDPIIVYTRPVFSFGFSTRYWSFGVGFPIGGWLTYDCDWRARNVYYNGWSDAYYAFGGGWRARSRPFIQITNIYVSPRYRNVYVNRDVVHYAVNYRNVDRYAGIHHDTWFDSRRGNDRSDYRDDHDRTRGDRDRGDNNNPNTRNSDSRDRNDGRDVNRQNDNQTRTAQPRDSRPGAEPDGYHVGGSDRIIRRTPPSNNSRQDVVAPEQRRNEPVQSRDIRIAPENNRATDRSEQRQVQPPQQPRFEPRQAQPQVQVQQRNEPRVVQPPQQPRFEPRQAPPQVQQRYEPRQSQPQSQPQQQQQQSRQAQPRNGGNERSGQPAQSSRGGRHGR